jgi:hypothetical protein
MNVSRNAPVSYRRIVVAISSGLLYQHAVGDVDTDVVATEIVGQHGRMPDYLRFPIYIATVMFDWSGILSGGKRFQAKAPAVQSLQLDSWKKSRIGFCRNFIRFYESLFLLITLQEESS